MGEPLRVPIKKEIWLWAIEESQKNVGEIFSRHPEIYKSINGEQHPTFKQLEKIADYLKIPFGYFFLEAPPKQDPIETEFRVINNKLLTISKNLKDTILEMDFRKNWMSDYRRSLGWNKLEIITRFNEAKTGEMVSDARLARELLDVTERWHEEVRDYDAAYNFIKEKLEHAGILVMQNSVVGMNNHRRLDINEFRAFMLYDDVAPLIFINRNDSKAGMIFSLIHEYLHVLFEQEDIFIDLEEATASHEQQINRLTAEFLVPAADIKQHWIANKDVLEQIDDLSRIFKVSRLAIAIKLKDMKLIDQGAVELIKARSIQDFQTSKRSSGSPFFYQTFKSRISPTFMEAVVTNAEAGDIEYTYAFRLLGVKGKTYDKIKEEVMAYG